MTRRRVSVFGSTGSIGENTIDLIARDPERYQVVALSGGRNVARLAAQARSLGAQVAVTAFDDCLDDLRAALAGSGIAAAAGADALDEAADRDTDWVMSAIVGAAGLRPGLRVLERGGTLALANKETLVAAGPLVMSTARANKATILPVDSEHSAIFQALAGEDIAAVERVIITASGGPFRGWTPAQLARATLEQASAHPNWDMGQRITIDSASMFNKALELIETKEFFDMDPSRIEVLVHPQSLVHALVGFNDGALMAHLGAPDMRHAIGYALNWPARAPLPVARLDLARIGTLSFEAPDERAFPALRLARDVMAEGGLAGAAFNAAKEVALDLFIAKRIGFADMATLVERVLERLSAHFGAAQGNRDLEAVLEMDHLARQTAVGLATSEPVGSP